MATKNKTTKTELGLKIWHVYLDDGDTKLDFMVVEYTAFGALSKLIKKYHNI